MNDMDTTRFDGAACQLCGEEAHDALRVHGRMYPVALCGVCLDEAVTICPQCERRTFTNDCTRIGSELYCDDCSAKHPAVVGDVMAAIKSDEQQDQFNRFRR